MSEPGEPNQRNDEPNPEMIDLEPVDESIPPPSLEPEPDGHEDPEPELEPEMLEVTITEPRGARSDARQPEIPLVRPGLGGARLALGLGVGMLVGALIASGIRAGGLQGAGARVVALAVAVTLYQSLLHTGTGVAAVMVAARIERRPTGALELAAARMLACVGAFQLVYHLPVLVPGAFGYIIAAVLGLLAYAAVVWALFRLTRLELGVVVAGHVLLLIAVMLGTHLTHLYRSAIEAISVATP